ncbi:unnamed protein product [Parajaminaea phylloscopi]
MSPRNSISSMQTAVQTRRSASPSHSPNTAEPSATTFTFDPLRDLYPKRDNDAEDDAATFVSTTSPGKAQNGVQRRNTATSTTSTSTDSSVNSSRSGSSLKALKDKFFGSGNKSPKAAAKKDHRTALSVSPPAYEEATTTAPASERPDPEVVLQQMMGNYGFGGSVACPVLPNKTEGKSKKQQVEKTRKELR